MSKKILFLCLLFFLNITSISADTPFFLDFKYILIIVMQEKKAQTFLKNKLEKGKDLKNKEVKIQEEEKNYSAKKVDIS